MTRASTRWHADSGLATEAAAAYRQWAGIRPSGPSARARLGVLDVHDERECAAKYGSGDRVRAMLADDADWPTVQALA